MAVTELLRLRWFSAWELWGSVFRALGGELANKAHKDRAAGKDESPAALIAACAELWMPRMAGRDRNESPGEPDDEALRLFTLDALHALRNLRGATGKLFAAIRDILGTTAGDWRKEQERIKLQVGGRLFPDMPHAKRVDQSGKRPALGFFDGIDQFFRGFFGDSFESRQFFDGQVVQIGRSFDRLVLDQTLYELFSHAVDVHALSRHEM